MEAIVELFVKTYGILGLFVAAPFAATVFLWRDHIKTRDEHAKELVSLHKEFAVTLAIANDRIVNAQEQRMGDVQLVRDKLMEMVIEQTATSRETNLALEKVGDFLALHQSEEHQKTQKLLKERT
jgi:alkylation response protein AidB-like acyl-CoA dehydrogenase